MKTKTRIIRKLGRRIRHLRQQRNWSQQHLASLIGVEQAYISSIERGVYCASVPKTAEIAEAFGITISDLFEGI